MANIITAGNSTNGGTAITTDTSGTLDIKTGTGSGTTAISVNASQATTFAAGVSGTTGSFSGDMSFNSGYGSAAVAYGCRAWVNFNGTGTVAIRASGNVTSITDNGTGDYTINFTTAMTDANYSIVCGSSPDFAPANSYGTYINTVGSSLAESAPTTSSARISYRRSDAVSYDAKYSNIAIFR